ncbi:MAG: hypothetical protein R3F59_30765 [Myxococcota bacterium]
MTPVLAVLGGALQRCSAAEPRDAGPRAGILGLQAFRGRGVVLDGIRGRLGVVGGCAP